MGLLYRLLHSKQIKRYDHILSLGYNCEVAFQLFNHNKFLESNLLAWTYVESLPATLFALEKMDLIGSRGFEGPVPHMYKCPVTNIFFHGKARAHLLAGNEALQQEDKEELKGRIEALKSKFRQAMDDGGKNLYIIKLQTQEENVRENLEKIYDFLTRNVKNAFDFLIIMEQKATHTFAKLTENENVYVRTVAFYAPESSVMTRDNDKKHWFRIFDEFMPRYKMKKKKRFKFEE